MEERFLKSDMKRTDIKSISSVIADYVAEDNMSEGLQRQRIFEAWDLVLGSPSFTLRKTYKDHVLTCKISTSVVRTQLSFNIESYRLQLNTLLQDDLVDKIVLL